MFDANSPFMTLHQPLQYSFPTLCDLAVLFGHPQLNDNPRDSQVTRVDVIDQKDYIPFLPQSWFSNDPIVQDTHVSHVLLEVTWAEWSLSIKTWLVQEEYI